MTVRGITKRIGSIKFSCVSPEEIRKMSATKIITADTYDDEGYPIDMGLMDPHMGVIEPGLRCKTCGCKVDECPGHFGHIDLAISKYALDALNIDKRGLNQIDNKILHTIIAKFKGGPVGVNTIATAVGEDQGSVEEVYEPFLIKEGFLQRTPRGRIATELAYRHLGFPVGPGQFDGPEIIEGSLF